MLSANPAASDTIAGVATPPGVGAVAIVRVSGPGTKAVVAPLLGRWPKPRRACVRTLRDPDGAVLDEALVLWMPGPKSFTGEDSFEVHTHGGRLVPGRVLEALVAAGARLAEPGEFSRRAFLAGRMTLEQAEAMNDLIHAETAAFAAVALETMRGGLQRRVLAARNQLLDMSALLEANLDFPEEDIPELDRPRLLADLAALEGSLAALADSYQRGRLLREGPRVALLGRPNAGKSSLLNAILADDRAIVTAEPGTTRDVLEEGLRYKGMRFRFLDTAGLREAPGEAERAGVARARAAADAAEVRVFVTVAGEPVPEEVAAVAGDPARDILVRNKRDLLRSGGDLFEEWNGLKPVFTAATEAAGVGEVVEAAHRLAAARLPRAGEDLVVTNLRHRDALSQAAGHLGRFRRALLDDVPYDVSLVELAAATDALGAILGAVGVEDILDRVFERFCIGK